MCCYDRCSDHSRVLKSISLNLRTRQRTNFQCPDNTNKLIMLWGKYYYSKNRGEPLLINEHLNWVYKLGCLLLEKCKLHSSLNFKRGEPMHIRLFKRSSYPVLQVSRLDVIRSYY